MHHNEVKMKSVQKISFNGYVPIGYYAKNPETNRYSRVVRDENIRKCQSFIVRNLNGTAKNMKDEGFVDFYKSYDRDYVNNPSVRSVYDKNRPVVYLVTGEDVNYVDKLAKPIGIAKGEAMDRYGSSKSFESASASNSFFRSVKAFFNNECQRLKSNDGQNLSLKVYFDPKYNKKNKLVGFNFVNARFVNEEV